MNATFRFIEKQFGLDGLRRYWTQMGQTYYAPVSQRWQKGGLQAVADHWRAFFAAEPGAEVTVTTDDLEAVVEVQSCPAIAYLRQHKRELLPSFCQQCYFVSSAIGAEAGIDVRIKGGNGCCTQRFARSGHFSEPQRLEAISTAS